MFDGFTDYGKPFISSLINGPFKKELGTLVTTAACE